jgi:hypothetical protein
MNLKFKFYDMNTALYVLNVQCNVNIDKIIKFNIILYYQAVEFLHRF